MEQKQIELTYKIVDDLRTINLLESGSDGEVSFSEILDKYGIKYGFIDYINAHAIGYSQEGLTSLTELAKTYRLDEQRAQQASNATLSQILASTIVKLFQERKTETLRTKDFYILDEIVDQWFISLMQTQLYAIPCIISLYYSSPFDIGPVHFCTWQDFPSEKFKVSREDFINEAEMASEDKYFNKLMQMAKERNACWVALVEITGRAEIDSKNAADIAIDIALGVLQIVAPGLDINNISRATDAVSPLWRADIWLTKDDAFPRQSISSYLPAATITPDLFSDVILNKVQTSLTIMGNRLNAYLSASSCVPKLDEALCNAIYWYHKAIAEPLDTVAIFKLETAIEVLFRSEDMAGSKRRLETSFDVFYGFTKETPLNDDLTVEQFIRNITTARSRIAHGTWPTIHTDIPGYKKQKPVSRKQVEKVARDLIINTAFGIEEYSNAGQTVDDTPSLFEWLKSQKPHTIE